MRRHRTQVLVYLCILVGVVVFLVVRTPSTTTSRHPPWEDHLLYHVARQIPQNHDRFIHKQNINALVNFSKIINRSEIESLIKIKHDFSSKLKILCMVKTQPNSIVTKAYYIKNTWGQKCDKTVYISSSSHAKLPAIGVLPGIREDRQIIAQKVFAGLRYVNRTYGGQYDWYFVGDDDTYVIVENLRYFLSTKNKDDPIYYGHRFMKYTPQGYSSGGSGYVMSREAMRRFGKYSHRYRDCNQTGQGSDFKVGQCLDALDVLLGISTDDEGRSRFHCFDILMHVVGDYPDWYMWFTDDGDGSRPNHISDYPISFHYSKGKMMYVLDHFLYFAGVKGVKAALSGNTERQA